MQSPVARFRMLSPPVITSGWLDKILAASLGNKITAPADLLARADRTNAQVRRGNVGQIMSHLARRVGLCFWPA